MRRQDSNLRPPGYELLKSVFSIAAQRLLALFHGKPGGRSPLRTTLSTLCYPRIGQNMGQKCGLAMGQPIRQLSPPNLDLRHIQDHFEFTFPRVALTGFSRSFSHPVFGSSACAGRFSFSAGNLLPRLQHGSKTWVRLFSLTRSRIFIPPQGVVIVP